MTGGSQGGQGHAAQGRLREATDHEGRLPPRLRDGHHVHPVLPRPPGWLPPGSQGRPQQAPPPYSQGQPAELPLHGCKYPRRRRVQFGQQQPPAGEVRPLWKSRTDRTMSARTIPVRGQHCKVLRRSVRPSRRQLLAGTPTERRKREGHCLRPRQLIGCRGPWPRWPPSQPL